MPTLAEEKSRALYGNDYVARFAENQDQFRLSRLLPHMRIAADASVVDLACGNGMLMPFVAPRVATYTGVDFSPEFVRAAKAHAEAAGVSNASFFCEDISTFCRQRTGHFDVAFAMDFSEHVYDAEWVGILRSIRQSLKPGASFFLHTPNASYFIERLKTAGVLRQLPEHVAVRDAASNISLLEEAGFREIEVTFLPHYEKRQAWIHHFRRSPFLGTLFEARLFIACKA